MLTAVGPPATFAVRSPGTGLEAAVSAVSFEVPLKHMYRRSGTTLTAGRMRTTAAHHVRYAEVFH